MEEGSAPTFWKRTGNLIVSVMDRTQRAMNRGRGKGDGNSNGGKSKKSRIPQGEKEMSTFLNNAQYEISQDPYRGLQSQQQSLETGTDITTPWNACCWGTLRPESATIKTVDSTAVVRHVGHCACPSLKAWTKTSKENNNKKKKGRKRGRQAATSPSLEEVFDIGTRPRDPNFRCLCDYNPLCLGTLGGVINDILIERSKDTEVIESSLTPEEECPAKKPQHEQRGTSILESLPIAKDCSSNEQDKNEEKGIILGQLEDTEQNDKVFDFLDERRDPVVKLKPLVDIERERIKRPPENPANVFVSDISKIDSIDIKYSSATADLLKGLRHSIHSDATTIRSYAHQTLGLNDDQPMDRTSTWTVDKYIDILNKWQKSLRFENPIRDVDEVQEAYDDPIIISIPPGIENLGATCYLNTQLQCLAQNPAFLNGIFSWRLVNSNHNMNSVMSKMQLLLAQMVLGGESKLSTLDFSNALGIEHDEQQDPNEFARLLFERMDESFQQCDNDGNLANLLQRNFHGITTYETICMTCTHSSERSEGFMDLNLPIAQREKQDDRKTTKKDITHYFGSKSVDTDVQYCLDQYTHAEVLDGDNQYFCSACNCKRDAKRVLKLTELPPILNVQLSRYVFDRTQFVKKKLSDKVLLPKTLQVPMSSGSKKDYVLCAVMRHQGTSAYRGHYVAEAMDWLTGQWFEFNDETVKLLSDGPSCSYDPAETEISEAKMSSLTGSQDAYNMYYVDENFLSKNALDDLSHKESLCTVDTKIIEDENNNVLAEVSKQRRAKYATLSK
jgi:ubiquitin carboxyl-terminal hydrolase 48